MGGGTSSSPDRGWGAVGGEVGSLGTPIQSQWGSLTSPKGRGGTPIQSQWVPHWEGWAARKDGGTPPVMKDGVPGPGPDLMRVPPMCGLTHKLKILPSPSFGCGR